MFVSLSVTLHERKLKFASSTKIMRSWRSVMRVFVTFDSFGYRPINDSEVYVRPALIERSERADLRITRARNVWIIRGNLTWIRRDVAPARLANQIRAVVHYSNRRWFRGRDRGRAGKEWGTVFTECTHRAPVSWRLNNVAEKKRIRSATRNK